MSRAAGFAGIAASATVAESLPIRQSIPASSAVCATGRWSVCPLPSAGGQAEFRLSRHGAGGGADCIFTDWAGDFSPIGAYHSSVVNVVDCTFRNMYLSAEIVDVSNDGIVRFQDALLANATLQYGNVVGTTTNDGTKADGFDLEYYDTDDDAFDVKLTPAPTSDRETSGVEFTIDESTLSDCLYLRAPTGFVMPGCPEASIQARAAVLQRDPAAGASAVAEDPSEVWNPGGRLDDLLLDGDSPWLQARQAELGPLPSAAVTGWPEFVLPPMRNLVNRTDVTRPRQELPDGELLGAFRRTPQAVNRTAAVLAAAALRGPIVVRPLREEVWQPRLVALVAVLAVAAAVAAAAAAWAALALRRDARERRDNQAARAAARQMDGDLVAGVVRPWCAVFMPVFMRGATRCGRGATLEHVAWSAASAAAAAPCMTRRAPPQSRELRSKHPRRAACAGVWWTTRPSAWRRACWITSSGNVSSAQTGLAAALQTVSHHRQCITAVTAMHPGCCLGSTPRGHTATCFRWYSMRRASTRPVLPTERFRK